MGRAIIKESVPEEGDLGKLHFQFFAPPLPQPVPEEEEGTEEDT